MATVTEIFASQQAYADSIGGVVDGLANTLGNLSTLAVSVVEPAAAAHTFYDAVNAAVATLQGAAPNAPFVNLPSVAAPSIPSIVFGQVEAVVVPDTTITPPSIVMPLAPTSTPITAPAAAAEFARPDIPAAPTFTIPTVPTLTQINLPAAPVVTLPSFVTTVPQITFSPPANNFAWAEAAYSSAMLDALNAKILTDLESGGYGIDDTDETRLVDRAIQREGAQAATAIEETERTYATRRFPVPPGAMYGAIERVRQAQQDALSTASREIHVKRSDLYVENRRFTIEQAKQMESILINANTAKLERLLNAAKYSAQFAIDFYNVQKEAFLASLEAYKTEASVFETRVRAEIEKLNATKIALEIERTKGDIDRNRLEAYKLQLSGLDMQVTIFKTRMQAAEVQASVEKLRLEAYRAGVDAYVATVKGRELEFQAYEAGIRGEEAKARVYESQMRGYSATVDAARTKADVIHTRVRSEVERANALVNLYNADNQRYRTEWEGNIDHAKLDMDAHRGAVDAYRARSSAVSDLARLGIANYDATSRDYHAALKQNLDRALLQLRVAESNRGHTTTTTKSLLDFYVQQVAAALSGINALATQSE